MLRARDTRDSGLQLPALKLLKPRWGGRDEQVPGIQGAVWQGRSQSAGERGCPEARMGPSLGLAYQTVSPVGGCFWEDDTAGVPDVSWE